MKYHLKYKGLCAIFFMQCYCISYGQDANPAYHFDGDDVVFLFDVRDYEKAIDEETSEMLDFSDLSIRDVAVSGDFNGWSKHGWKMNKRGRYIYELRKRVDQFNDVFSWDFRYVINGKHIISQALEFFPNKSFDKQFFSDAFDLDINQIKVNERGKIRFYLAGHKQYKEVFLTGSFNSWDEHELNMKQTVDGWELKADLAPGIYEYKFIADGNWLHDPGNVKKKRNEYASFNSILEVTVPVTLKLQGFLQAKKVILAGSFNEWSTRKVPMKLLQDGWTVTIDLPGGKHFYKFIVDGQWMTDPASDLLEDDGKGNTNSVLLVR